MLPESIPDDVYRLFIDSVEDYAMFLIDLDGRVASWNAGAERVKLWRAEEIIGEHYGVLSTREDRDAGRPEERLRIAARDGTYSEEGWRTRKGGIRYWAHITLTALRDDDDALVGFAKITRDLSARQRAEAERARLHSELRVHEQRMRLLVDGINDYAIVSLDGDGRVQSWNAGARALTGWSAQEAIGRHMAALEPDGATTAADGVQEGWWARRDGSRARVSWSVSDVQAPDGQMVGQLVVVRDLTEDRLIREELVRLASQDPLTGLANRRRFDEELERVGRQARRRGEPFAVLMIDLDDFKKVNDVHGHRVGDELLIAAAAVLRRRLREVDLLARLGGDEFGVILAAPTSAEQARGVVEALRAQIAGQSVRAAGATRVPVSASIGVAVYDPRGAAPGACDDVLVRADLAMYEAKAAGPGRSREYTPAAGRRAFDRVAIADDLRHALTHGGLTLHAQPICALRDGAGARFELLLRMRNADGRLLAPGQFLPQARTLGLMVDIDRWVVAAAAKLAGERAAWLHINLSGAAVQDRRLLAFIERQLRDADVDPAKLTFEVTETEAITNLEAVTEFAARLAEVGCGFSLDDFGTGFAAYLHLTHLPIDVVKIDARFVSALVDSPLNQAVVETMTALAHRLDKRVVAEAVEDARTLKLLCRFGVDYAQGFHLGRPQPAEAVLPASE